MPKIEEQKLGSNIYKMVAYALTGAPEDQLFGVNVARNHREQCRNQQTTQAQNLPLSAPSGSAIRYIL